MFRNARFYRIDGHWPDSEQELSDKLASAAFKPCGPMTERSSGWEAVCPEAGDLLARRLNGADLVRMRTQARILPHAAVREELEVRLDDYRQRMGEEPTGREKRRLKAEIRDELLTRAMLKSDRVWGFVDLKEKVLAIDSAGEPNAERFIRRLKAALGDLPLKPLDYKQPVEGFLKQLFLGSGPRQFALGRECRMQDPTEPKSKVRWSDFDLNDKSIRDHVAHGMRLTHLAIVYDNVLSCVIDEHGTIGRIKLVGLDEDNELDNDPVARFDAEFALITGTLRLLLADLKKLLGGFA